MVQHINLLKLASQDRAYSSIRPWSEKELKALLTFEKECDLSRAESALYVRNGIVTVEAYKKAVKAKFKPKTLEEIQEEAVKKHHAGVLKQFDEEANAKADEEAKTEAEAKAKADEEAKANKK